MKKLATIKNEMQKLEADKKLFEKLVSIANNEAVTNSIEALTKREKLALLQYAELEKALTNKKYSLVLDINYENFKSEAIIVTQYSYIDSANQRVLHIYQHTDTFDICFSCKEAVREKLTVIEALEKSINVINRKDTNKTTVYKQIHFDDLFNACKFATMLLESNIDDLQIFVENTLKAEAE